MLNLVKLPVRKSNVALRVAKGHFVTNHSHINYYIDVTFQKSRLSEAQAVAKALVKQYVTSTIVDTIVCLDGMQVVGTCLADELTRAGFMSINAHQTIYVIAPELSNESQLFLRDNLQPMMLNAATDGKAWVEHQVELSQILGRNECTHAGSETLWEYARKSWIEPNVESGRIRK
mgnify:CR=1 FL=1